MAARHTAQARASRETLLHWLGGLCAVCGAQERLTFDHPQGRSWCLQRLNARSRLRVYTWEADQGLLRILCHRCNSADGGRRSQGRARPGHAGPDLFHPSPTNEPF